MSLIDIYNDVQGPYNSQETSQRCMSSAHHHYQTPSWVYKRLVGAHDISHVYHIYEHYQTSYALPNILLTDVHML